MAEQWGGKRTPGRPAPVSGPGQLSQRTDGGPQQVQARMSGMPYGENAEFNTMQSAAPMAASPSAASPRAMERKAAQSGRQVTPLFAPTQRPDEPITAGAPFGPGEGPSAAQNPGVNAINRADAQMLSKYLPDLMQSASAPNAPDGFVRFVRHLRNIQGIA